MENRPTDPPDENPSSPDAEAIAPFAGPLSGTAPPAFMDPPPRFKNDALIAVGVGLLYLLFFQVTAHLPFSNIGVITLTTLLSLPLLLLFTVGAARAMQPPRAFAVGIILSAVLALPAVLVPILFRTFPAWHGWIAIASVYKTYRLTISAVPGLNGLLLIWFAAAVGVGVSKLVRETKMLLPIAVALACVDLYVVFGGGLVTQAQSGHAPVAQKAMEALTVKLPTVSPPKGGAAPMELAVGFADFLFIALFFACFAKFGIPARRTFSVLCGVLIGYMVIVAWTGNPLPALVPIAVVVIGMNIRRFRYERSEAFALLYAGLIVAAVAGGFFFFTHHR